MVGYLRVQAESRNGQCVLRIAGDLDMITAGEFADRADQEVAATPGPVVVDLSGLTFIDARGARALATMIDALPAGRQAVVRSCPPHVRLVLDMLGLPPNYLSADYLSARNRMAPQSATRDLVDRVQDARHYAGAAKLGASWVLSRLADTRIRLASTRERTGLLREQGQRTVASSRAVREYVIRSRQETAI